MYEESKKRLNWVAIVLKVLLLLLVILLSIKLVTLLVTNRKSSNIKKEYDTKLESIHNYALDYFKDNIPEKSGESTVIYLNVLVDSEKLEDIDKCDMTKSYIKVVKLDNEYQVKTYLTCKSYENSMNSFNELKPKETTTTKTTTTKKKTTKKKTTTTTAKVKRYIISFNTNGGSLINDLVINESGVIDNLPTPTRDGYKFVGWYYHGTQFDKNTKINSDYVLTAKWIKE